MADEVALELAKQEDQIARMQKTVKDTQSVLKRSAQLIRYFARTLATDKIIMCLLFLVVAAMITLLVLKYLNLGAKDVYVPDRFKK